MNFTLFLMTALIVPPTPGDSGSTSVNTEIRHYDRSCFEAAKLMSGVSVIDPVKGIRVVTRARCVLDGDRYPPGRNGDPYDYLFGRPNGVYKD